MRLYFHILLGILLWIVFGYYWYIVVQRPIGPQTRLALIAVAVIVVALTLALVAWIFYNIRLARRFKRRQTRLRGVKRSATDFLGRQLVFENEVQVMVARHVRVNVEDVKINGRKAGELKVYRIANHTLAGPPAG